MASVKTHIQDRTISFSALGLLAGAVALVCAAAGGLQAADVIAGAGGPVTRIVFYLRINDTISPDLVAQDRTLYVNFPYKVARPHAISDRFLIDKLTFDGTRASIVAKRPFTYTWSLKQVPDRLVIDLREKPAAQAGPKCPVKRMDTTHGASGARVSIFLDEGARVWVRLLHSNRILVQFQDGALCQGMERLFAASPIVSLQGFMKMDTGEAFILNIDGLYTLKSAKKDASGSALTFDLALSRNASPAALQELGERLYAAGDHAGAIRILEGASASLDTRGRIALARAYWAASYPYAMGPDSNRALALMERAHLDAAGTPEAKAASIEFCSMLMGAGRVRDASRILDELEDSPDKFTRLDAAVLKAASLNRQGSYDDAYAVLRGIGPVESIPEQLRQPYSATLADTHLGLNDFARALELYRQTLALGSAWARTDPGIYGRMGEAAFKMNDFATARDCLVPAVNLAPGRERQRYLIMLGDSLYELGEKENAQAAFSQAEEQAASTGEAAIAGLKRARIIVEKNMDERGRLSDKGFSEAMDIYETIMDERKKGTPDESLRLLVMVRIAQTLARHGEVDKALDTYLDVWKNARKDESIRRYAQVEAIRLIIEQCRILSRDARYDRVIALYTRYRDSFVKELWDGSALFAMGEALYRSGRLEEARAMIERSTRTDFVSKEQAFPLLFFIDYKRERYQEALLWNTIYLSTYPRGRDVPLMRHWRGMVLYRAGEMDAAVPFLEESASTGGPFAIQSLDALARIYRAQGKAQKEQETLDRIIAFHPARLSPVIEDALFRRADALMRQGDPDGASRLYEALLKAYPRSLNAHWAMYHLARISLSRGDTDKARERLEEVKRLSRDPVLIQAAHAMLDDAYIDDEIRHYRTSSAERPGG
jgi:tetratricopeptide (TPR) repeat protein